MFEECSFANCKSTGIALDNLGTLKRCYIPIHRGTLQNLDPTAQQAISKEEDQGNRLVNEIPGFTSSALPLQSLSPEPLSASKASDNVLFQKRRTLEMYTVSKYCLKKTFCSFFSSSHNDRTKKERNLGGIVWGFSKYIPLSRIRK